MRPDRPDVDDATRLADLGRQDPRLQRDDPDAQPQSLAKPGLDRAGLAWLRELHLHLDLVHRGGVGVKGDPELSDLARLAHDLLDRSGEHVHPPDHHHVVSPAENAAGEPSSVVMAGTQLTACLDYVSGPVTNHWHRIVLKRGHDNFPHILLQ